MAHIQHTESVPVIPLLGRPKGVGGRRRKRHRQGKKKKKNGDCVAYFVVATFTLFESQVWRHSSESFIVGGASVSVPVPVPVRSSRTAMRLQCFVLAVCL